MLYVVAKTKKKQVVAFDCDTEEEALTVQKNLMQNKFRYVAVTIKYSSPYVRGTGVRRFNRNTLPTIYKEN